MTQAIWARHHVTEMGAGTPVIVLAHGFGCDQRMWRLVAPAFADDYRLVLFDYVGAGGSQRGAYSAERYGSLGGYAQDVLDICAALDLSDITLVGHSVSGMIGMLAALRAPERFARLIMIGASPRYLNDPPDYVGGFERAEIEGLLDLMERNYDDWAGFLAPLAMRNEERPELAGELIGRFQAADALIMHRFATIIFFSDNRQIVWSQPRPWAKMIGRRPLPNVRTLLRCRISWAAMQAPGVGGRSL